MSIGTPIDGRRGYDLFERDFGRVDAWQGSDWAGYVFPLTAVLPADESGRWVTRRAGETAVHVDTRHSALAHLLGGCPACVCEPGLCDPSGMYCDIQECRACLSGCPEGECAKPEVDQ